jgi:hypothetical protein
MAGADFDQPESGGAGKGALGRRAHAKLPQIEFIRAGTTERAWVLVPHRPHRSML